MTIAGVLFVDKVLFGSKLALHWSAYMNGVEASYNMKFLGEENACFELFERTYIARQQWVKNDCK